MDSTDRRIIELLAGNGRLSYAELARQIGLSGPAMHERVGKLEATGVIQAYRAQVDQEAVGLGVTAFIGIVQGVDSEIDDIVASMSELPEIESCYFLAGTESFLDPGPGTRDRGTGAADRAAQPDPRHRRDPDHDRAVDQVGGPAAAAAEPARRLSRPERTGSSENRVGGCRWAAGRS